MQYMRTDHLRDGEFWRTSAARLLSILLFAGAHADQPLDAVTGWLTSSSSSEVVDILEDAGSAIALQSFDDFAGHRSDSYTGSVRATALTAMQTYEDSRVARRIQAGGLDPDK